MLYRPGVHGGQDFTTRRNPQLFPWLLPATKIRISLLWNSLARRLLPFPKHHLEICITLIFKHPSRISSLIKLQSCRIFKIKFISLDKAFFFPTKIRIRKKKFSGRCIYNTTVTQIFVHLYYLRRDDFTKLNFCRPTVNNDNSRPSLSAPAEARQRLQVVVVLARDIVLPRQETRSEAANAPASDTGFIREICAEGVPLPSLFSLSRIMQRKMNRKRRSIPLFPS